jgi:hypothetical protein
MEATIFKLFSPKAVEFSGVAGEFRRLRLEIFFNIFYYFDKKLFAIRQG